METAIARAKTEIAIQEIVRGTIIAEANATPTNTLIPTNTPVPPKTQKQITLDEAIKYLDQKTLSGYNSAYELLRIPYLNNENDEEYNVLFHFSNDMFMIMKNGYDSTQDTDFTNSPPNYSGIYNEEIKKTVLNYISMDEWDRRCKDWGAVSTRVAIKNMRPVIGMTSEQVRNLCGYPQKNNRTTTKYGASEQWVYSTYTNKCSGIYVYVDNGIVTAIQD
jgi:hypothetical protein